MRTVVVYIVRTEDHYRLGEPAVHLLEEPRCLSRTWIERAEYTLPAGYHVGHTVYNELAIYSDNGNKYCDLADSVWNGKGGGVPCLIDIHAAHWCIKLKKVRDLPW